MFLYNGFMEDKKPTFLTVEGLNFLSEFIASYQEAHNLKSDNESTISSAVIYEKLRVAVEYQEDHLVLKNAMSRILRRKYTLAPNITAHQMFSDLISELAWANYINPERLPAESAKRIIFAIEKYLVILRSARTARFNRHELIKTLLDWLACELDELLQPDASQAIIVDYTYKIISKNLETDSLYNNADTEIQLKAAIYGAIFKPDLAQIQYWFLKHIYTDWSSCDHESAKNIATSFDPFFNKIDHALNNPQRRNYIQFTKRLIPPFIILYSVLRKRKVDLEKVKERPALIHNLVMEEYNQKISEARSKVWRGTFRALIFILITKISLAFIIEIPYDNFTRGSVDLLSLITNISLPPLLMLFAGTFVKSPPHSNYKIVSESVAKLLAEDKIDDKKYSLVKKQSATFLAFNFFYSIFSLLILFAIVMLLISLKFNIVSILLFFLFISVVSFFSFRIRTVALELAMRRARDDALTSVFEFIMMPFIRIGKFFSDQLSTFNPMILALDFLIEAPLKTVIKIMNSWLRFFNAKKEELDL